MLWFTFYNSDTKRNEYVNLANYSVAIGDTTAHIHPAHYSTDAYFVVRGKDLERLRRLMEREARIT